MEDKLKNQLIDFFAVQNNFSVDFFCAENITEDIVILCRLGLDIFIAYPGNGKEFKKCWSNIEKDRIKLIDGIQPSFHKPYNTFKFNNIIFYPYSIANVENKGRGLDIKNFKDILLSYDTFCNHVKTDKD